MKNNKLNKDFNISDTLADFFPLFLETPWHLIDTGFSNKVGEKLSQYNPRMFYYTLGNDFCDTYNDYLVDFRMKIKKEIFEELKYITLDDILQENPFLKELYSVKFIIENNLPDLYDNNSDLYNQMLDFEKFSFEEKRHINKQREFHRKILNSFDNIEDILKLKIIDFVNKFDVSYDKKLVDKIKLNKDRYDYTIKELINSIDTHENHSLFLYPGSDFLQVFNAFGGYWLIMFDLIRIQKNQSETFDFYQTFLNKDKQSSLPYKKKFIHLLFLCSQFLNNKKLNIEELREFIDLKYSQSSREDIEDLEVFCKLFLSHEPYVSTIEELFLDYHI